jgi:hypothetical protein
MKVCSKECRKQRTRKYQKNRYKLRAIHKPTPTPKIKNCFICNIEFATTRNIKYCELCEVKKYCTYCGIESKTMLKRRLFRTV